MNTDFDALPERGSSWWHETKEVIKSLGIVFGDIGTSPIYTLSVVFFHIPPTIPNILGVLSLIVWTLVLLVGSEYAWLAMSLGKKGEGGTIVLREIVLPLIRSPRHAQLITLLSFIGISLFFGDGVITPAISILSAVEGLTLMPGGANISHTMFPFIACIITIGLFAMQRRGTEKVSVAFGPIMVLWFFTLSCSGLMALLKAPWVIKAVNPYYALAFVYQNGLSAFFVLSSVILCATGGEALYADMGHLGRKPIIRAWYVVFVALILTYLGQGAFLVGLGHNSDLLFYQMMKAQFPVLYVPILVLSLCATVIASQAMISGIFSVVYQGITTNLIPKIRIDYTSSKLRSQVYISFINWSLLLAVLIIILKFKSSHNLADAYGLAVTGTMTVTGIMMSTIFYHRQQWGKLGIALFITMLDATYMLSNLYKIPHGGYWSIIIAAIPFGIILLYTQGQKKLYNNLQAVELDTFLLEYTTTYTQGPKLTGTALFFARDTKAIQPYIEQTMFKNGIMYEENIVVLVITRDDPFGVIGFFKGELAPGLQVFEIHRGYMEMLDVERILADAGIQPKVIFYGLEDIVTKNILWKLYAAIKQVAPAFVQFYKLPANKLHGVITRVEL